MIFADMFRSMAFRDFFKLPVPCPVCSEITHQTVAWLVDHDELICGECDVPIDLRLNEMRGFIEHADKICTLVDGSIKGS
jgi:hypothetical protein